MRQFDFNGFSFEKLLKPYEEGGSNNNPIKRTIGGILDWLIFKRMYPSDIASAGMVLVFIDLHNGKVFKGDGSFGSAGDELDRTIATVCNGLVQHRLKDRMYQELAEEKVAEVCDYFAAESARALPWFIKMFSYRYWQIRYKKRKMRKPKKVTKDEPV